MPLSDKSARIAATYRRKAAALKKAAAEAEHEHVRERLLAMAEVWLERAVHEEEKD